MSIKNTPSEPDCAAQCSIPLIYFVADACFWPKIRTKSQH